MLLMLNGLNFGLVDTPLMAVYVFCRLALTLSMNLNFKKSPFLFFQPDVASKGLELRNRCDVKAADGADATANVSWLHCGHGRRHLSPCFMCWMKRALKRHV